MAGKETVVPNKVDPQIERRPIGALRPYERGSVRCVVGEAGIYRKVILVDLEKAVKAVGSVIAGGQLGF
jgi:hypothetical protein